MAIVPSRCDRSQHNPLFKTNTRSVVRRLMNSQLIGSGRHSPRGNRSRTTRDRRRLRLRARGSVVRRAPTRIAEPAELQRRMLRVVFQEPVVFVGEIANGSGAFHRPPKRAARKVPCRSRARPLRRCPRLHRPGRRACRLWHRAQFFDQSAQHRKPQTNPEICEPSDGSLATAISISSIVTVSVYLQLSSLEKANGLARSG